jgi:hypothetical protein
VGPTGVNRGFVFTLFVCLNALLLQADFFSAFKQVILALVFFCAATTWEEKLAQDIANDIATITAKQLCNLKGIWNAPVIQFRS